MKEGTSKLTLAKLLPHHPEMVSVKNTYSRTSSCLYLYSIPAYPEKANP